MADLSIQEELQRTKETHAHSQTLYEKEVRRARKEAFKASSATVKLQEELKTARNRFTLMREEAEAQRRKAEGRDQAVFSAEYLNVGLQEEIEKVKQQLKAAEDERDALRTSLKKEEVARIAAEGKIPLPVSKEQDEFSSPKKSAQRPHRESLKENEDPMAAEEFDEEAGLREQLGIERRVRQRAEAQIDFMKMECQFRCCSCRIAESQGKDYIHDNSLAQQTSAGAPTTEDIQSNAAKPSLAVEAAEEIEDRKTQPQLDDATPQPLSRLTTPLNLHLRPRLLDSTPMSCPPHLSVPPHNRPKMPTRSSNSPQHQARSTPRPPPSPHPPAPHPHPSQPTPTSRKHPPPSSASRRNTPSPPPKSPSLSSFSFSSSSSRITNSPSPPLPHNTQNHPPDHPTPPSFPPPPSSPHHNNNNHHHPPRTNNITQPIIIHARQPNHEPRGSARADPPKERQSEEYRGGSLDAQEADG